MTEFGILHPGEMGAAIGAALRGRDLPVCWAGSGRSAATTRRAETAGLRDAGSVAAVCAAADVIVSICPPHAALEVAASVAAQGFSGTYLDANAISPGTAARVAETVGGSAAYVDGGVVGPPPTERGRTRLFLSGDRAAELAGLLGGGPLEAIALDGGTTAASALKMTYAAWTKGSAALLLALREAARGHGVEDALAAEWARSQPALADRWESALDSARAKGWRWTAEMTEIARTFAEAGQPAGFHEAAAEVYGRYERPAD
jgi:3-hydroxyisobutyrate dehydrogenase-like beta-hydroxyacid dehydrogenase